MLGFVLPFLGFLLFGIFTLWMIHDSASMPSEDDKRSAERMEILGNLQADEAQKFCSEYGWVDSSKKIVRIPVSLAMNLVLLELQKKHVAPAYPMGSSPSPTPSVPAATPKAPVPVPTKTPPVK